EVAKAPPVGRQRIDGRLERALERLLRFARLKPRLERQRGPRGEPLGGQHGIEALREQLLEQQLREAVGRRSVGAVTQLLESALGCHRGRRASSRGMVAASAEATKGAEITAPQRTRA